MHHWKSDTVSKKEADLAVFLLRQDAAAYLRGHDLPRARRLVELGLAVQGRLGERYFELTPKGREFAQAVLQSRTQEGAAA